MPIPLTNDRWGYESNCFVCEPSNRDGLRVPFFVDDDGERVFAEFRLGFEHSGAPTIVHGGLSLALLDEAQAWACIAIAGQWALTRETRATFDGVVSVDQPHRVEARVTLHEGDRLETEGQIVDEAGELLVRSWSSFVVLGPVDPDQRALGLRPEHENLLGD